MQSFPRRICGMELFGAFNVQQGEPAEPVLETIETAQEQCGGDPCRRLPSLPQPDDSLRSFFLRVTEDIVSTGREFVTWLEVKAEVVFPGCAVAMVAGKFGVEIAALISIAQPGLVQTYITETLTRLVSGWPQDRADQLRPWSGTHQPPLDAMHGPAEHRLRSC